MKKYLNSRKTFLVDYEVSESFDCYSDLWISWISRAWFISL